MPEGDTISRAASSLRKVLEGQTVVTAFGRRELEISRIVGFATRNLESRGKHLVFHFENQLVLHSHMGMTGEWHIYRLQDQWQKPKSQAAVSLTTGQYQAVCFTPKLIELVTATRLSRDPYLQRLGPDLLGEEIPDQTFLDRMKVHGRSPIGEAIMNQTIVCGVGNVYKSEVLFLCGIHPQTRVSRIPAESLLQLRDQASFLMRRNLENGPRRTRFRADRYHLWVYGRRGEACLKCGSEVQMIRQGDLSRSTYYCSICQPPLENGAAGQGA